MPWLACTGVYLRQAAVAIVVEGQVGKACLLYKLWLAHGPNVVQVYIRSDNHDGIFLTSQNSFVTRKLYLLVNICERGWPTEKILQVMSHTCQRLPSLTGIN